MHVPGLAWVPGTGPQPAFPPKVAVAVHESTVTQQSLSVVHNGRLAGTCASGDTVAASGGTASMGTV